MFAAARLVVGLFEGGCRIATFTNTEGGSRNLDLVNMQADPHRHLIVSAHDVAGPADVCALHGLSMTARAKLQLPIIRLAVSTVLTDAQCVVVILRARGTRVDMDLL